MMKLLLVAMLMCQSFAAFVARGSRGAARGASAMTTALNEGQRINEKIELETPKVVTQVTLEPGKKGVYCRCWLSEKFPLCDGTHAKHNEATGDNVGRC